MVENASKFIVEVNENSNKKSYTAELITQDKDNDLAILKVSDSETYSLGVIPFNLATSGNDVGTSVFVLGFPLRATMGDEVKLTNGIISSKSGFQGDITSYQISAPVQPGNSGGPLLNQNGELIGIINAKHVGAENVSYAIKCNYLNNLIEQLPIEIILKSQSLNNKILSEQVKIVKNFIYIVEVN